ncbi:hypothetical protein IJ765_02620 [Candidatus Saccharibacteria bacterium]|nr:hypothetical protein [Candidatus Saccharibacteria bacterium]
MSKIIDNTIKGKSFLDLIDATTIRKFDINDNKEYSITEKYGVDLLVPRRIDLVAKYMLLLFKNKKIKSDLAKNVYRKHIEAFSDGRFYEPDSQTKTNYDAFLTEYDKLFHSIKKNSFNPKTSLIPVGNDGVIINGAHRVAISIFLNSTVYLLDINDHSGPHYNYRYFTQRHLGENYLDFLTLNYMKITRRPTFVICLWPKATSMNKLPECERLINRKTDVIYKKELPLKKLGLKNFMMHLYHTEKWVGAGKNNYVGAYGKADSCYTKKSNTILYFVEAKNLDTILKLKEDIRSIYNVGKHSVHITDTPEEAMLAANLTLNPNSVSVLNNGYPGKLNAKLDRLREYSTKTERAILNPLYTLQYFGYTTEAVSEDFYDVSKLQKDVEYDINNFFYYRGFKFFSPEYAKELCNDKYRKEFDAITQLNKISIKAKVKESFSKNLYKAKRTARFALRKAGLLEPARKIIRKTK